MNVDGTADRATDRPPVSAPKADSVGTTVAVVGSGGATAGARETLDGEFDLVPAETADDALACLADDCRPIDCIVSEYRLPETDGVTFLEWIRERYPTFPFVLITDYGDEEVASDAVAAGVTHYLPGGDAERLRDCVDEATEGTRTSIDTRGRPIRELTSAFPDVAFIIDERGRYLERISGPDAEDLVTVRQQRLVGRRLHDVFPEGKADRFLEHIHRTLDSGDVETMEYPLLVTSGTRWFEGRTAPLYRRPNAPDAVVWVARDITERVADERTLEKRRDELATLHRINDLIHSVLQSLVGSPTRDRVERTVCDRLANSEFYRFAWVGQPRLGDRGTAAGLEADTAEQFAATLADSADDAPIADGMSVVRDVRDEGMFGPKLGEAFADRDVSSVCFVPLTYGRTSYGLLAVGATTAETFGEHELTGFETLGEIIGFAINAAKNRRLLLSDAAVELTFRDDDSDIAFRNVSEEFGCRCRLEAVVPVSEERWLQYVAVDAPPNRVAGRLASADRIETFRVVNEEADGCVVEVVMAESAVNRLIEAGAAVTDAVATDGELRLTAEVSPDVDVRAVVDAFRMSYPKSELVCKQEIDNPVQTAREWRRILQDDLTEKQRTALQTAYFAGYYNHPRDSTAEEVADSMGITSPTLHQHLQAAQRKLLAAFFEK